MSATAKLGALMLASLVVLAIFILNIEKISLEGAANRREVRASFASVAGLDAKSPVRTAGVRVGVVEKIELDGSRALLTLSLDPSVPLHEGATATLRSIGLLGDLYVDLDPGPADAPPLGEDVVIAGTSPSGLEEVLQKASSIGDDVKGITTSIRGAVGGEKGQERLEEILDNIRELSASIRDLVAANRGDVDATVANFREFSATLRDELPKLAEKLNRVADGVDEVVASNRDNLHDSLENIRDLTARLRTSADNLNEITGKIAAGEGSIGKLVNDDTTVNRLNRTLETVESGVSSLRDTIGRPERWKLDVSIRSESLPRINDSRTSFGGELFTSDRKFVKAGLVDSPQGRRRETEETTTTTHPDGTSDTIVESKVRTTDNFTWNAQAGYVVGNTRLRAGLFESTGGVGIDQSLFRNRVGLTFEAYDFDRDVKGPHIRLEARWFVNDNVFTYAGWDDPRYSKRQSAFVGAGIRWTDDDLKYLLGSVASAAP